MRPTWSTAIGVAGICVGEEAAGLRRRRYYRAPAKGEVGAQADPVAWVSTELLTDTTSTFGGYIPYPRLVASTEYGFFRVTLFFFNNSCGE
jgi:hypothetical protein